MTKREAFLKWYFNWSGPPPADHIFDWFEGQVPSDEEVAAYLKSDRFLPYDKTKDKDCYPFGWDEGFKACARWMRDNMTGKVNV